MKAARQEIEKGQGGHFQCQNPACLDVFKAKTFSGPCPSCGQVNRWRESADDLIQAVLNGSTALVEVAKTLAVTRRGGQLHVQRFTGEIGAKSTAAWEKGGRVLPDDVGVKKAVERRARKERAGKRTPARHPSDGTTVVHTATTVTARGPALGSPEAKRYPRPDALVDPPPGKLP